MNDIAIFEVLEKSYNLPKGFLEEYYPLSGKYKWEKLLNLKTNIVSKICEAVNYKPMNGCFYLLHMVRGEPKILNVGVGNLNVSTSKINGIIREVLSYFGNKPIKAVCVIATSKDKCFGIHNIRRCDDGEYILTII